MNNHNLSYADIVNKKYYISKLPLSTISDSKKNLETLLSSLNPNESEEHNKNIIRDFLINIGYDSNQVNTSNRIDLAISNDDNVNVIIETKDFNNPEMISTNNINKKALHEIIYYFMREYLINKNNYLTYLIATNGIDWFIFDAKNFKKLFIDDKKMVNDFNASFNKSLTDSSTNNFYKNIAKPKVEQVKKKLKYYCFNFNNEINRTKVSNKLASNIYKLFSPITMFKKTFVSDSNSLNTNFYNELLYIIGLKENGTSGNIERMPKSERQQGSLIELIEFAISGTKRAWEIPPKEKFDDMINISMSFINRLLFLKLLEGQLVSFNKDDKKYKFLNNDNIQSFSDVDDLFFKVLAIPYEDRIDYLKNKYPHIPYLNSSLFEKTDVEEAYDVSPIKFKDNFSINIFNKSVLKKRISKSIKQKNTLSYLLDFLNSYSFSASNKSFNNQRIINSSILGSIFEKINGYKDGSFFTPGFVTSYMSESSIKKALINKFNRDGYNISKFSDLMNLDKDYLLSELNNFHLVDPSVGSGHFLVSALNYLVKVRSELGLINQQLSFHYNVHIVNDELFIDNESLNDSFSYIRGIDILTNIQKSLFNTKQEIIENNLFGVDLNKNSVNITKLRLWIELLKNSYYKNDNLVTMPNLEMNVKSGNSLISRYSLDEPLSNVSHRKDITITKFKKLVADYKNTSDKSKKYRIEKDIADFKNRIIKSINKNNIDDKINKLYQDYHELNDTIELLPFQKLENKKKKDLSNQYLKEIKELERKRKNLSNNQVYKNSFEWRFEFPELLDSHGKFIGFDLVIANPPYINMDNNKELFDRINKTGLGKYSHGRMNIFYYFIHLAINLLNEKNGTLSFITTNYWLTNDFSDLLRGDLKARTHIFKIIDFVNYRIFSSAIGQNSLIIEADKGSESGNVSVVKTNRDGYANPNTFNNIISGKDTETYYNSIDEKYIYDDYGRINISVGANGDIDNIVRRLNSEYDSLGKYVFVRLGITSAPNKAFILSKKELTQIKNDLNEFELSLMKPLLNGTSINNYFESNNFDKYIAYITNDVDENQIPNLVNRMFLVYPNIKKSASSNNKNKFYVLARARDISKLQSPQTIFVSKLSPKPIFMMNNNKYVIKDDARFIHSNDTSIKSDLLLILLNSTLARFLFIYNGITKGLSIIMKQSTIDVIPKPNIKLINDREVNYIVDNMKQNGINKNIQKSIDSFINKIFNISDNQFQDIINYLENSQLK